MSVASEIWTFLKSKGFNDYACAGIMANLYAESGLNPKNLQDSCQARLCMDDETYTELVDSGVYTRTQFIYDQAGYGLAQWTYWYRAAALYDFCKARGASIGDLSAQLEFFYKELSDGFLGVLDALMVANSVKDATITVMLKYECPHDQSAAAQNKRIATGQAYYSQFATIRTGGVVDMGYKYYTKGKAVKISDHFYSTEFDCHGSGCCTQTKVNDRLPVHLEMIRNHFNSPVTITSPYRCEIHNSRIGGAVGSRHSRGDACDIVVKGVPPRTVAQYCESIGILGIGLYETKDDGYFVHIDERDYKSFWYGQSEQPRTTFGTSQNSYTPSVIPNNNSVLDTILNIGDSGQAVKSLQEKLIKLGYSCGAWGADGDFGNDTYQAVRKFQEAVKIGVDGIAGHGTLAAVDAEINKLELHAADNNVGLKVSVTASLLNVRSGPGTNYGIVKQIKYGTLCNVLEEREGWCKIDAPSGWVSKDYIVRI